MKNHKQATTKRPFRKGKRFVFGSSRSTNMMKSFKILLHIIAVSGIVINSKNQILMINSNNYGWVFPGGQVEEGENLINALKREVFEETGIKISVGFVSRHKVHGKFCQFLF